MSDPRTRRGFLAATVGLSAGLLACQKIGATEPDESGEDVSPAEDLMREHGVLKRVILIYREAIRRLEGREELPLDELQSAAGIIRTFIEDYHEKLEEDYLFPRFEKAGKLADLAGVLRTQHQAGRRLTDVTKRLATISAIRLPADRGRLVTSLRDFIRMYEPHEAREDTVLFPTLRSIVSENEYDSLGEEFEKKEQQLFGKGGFEKMVDKVAGIEKNLGIYDLARFTPTTS
jgi:hemerythrin-like domain-containing protein